MGREPRQGALIDPGTRAIELLKRFVIHLVGASCNRLSQACQAVEGLVAERGDDTAVKNEHVPFEGRLIARVASPSWQGDDVVMVAEILGGPVEDGIVEIRRAGHSRLQAVEDDGAGNPPDILEGALVCGAEVHGALGERDVDDRDSPKPEGPGNSPRPDGFRGWCGPRPTLSLRPLDHSQM